MRRGSFHVKTLRSRSSALLRAVTFADQRRRDEVDDALFFRPDVVFFRV
jgi:hypothetical protein